jgi:IS1 family transposase
MQKIVLILESVVVLILIGLLIWARHKRALKRWWQEKRKKPKRVWNLRPRTPEDCLDCRLAAKVTLPDTERALPTPWSIVKSSRGRPKKHNSDGHACMNPSCRYYKITDAHIHALRWDGQRNQCEATDQWECGACGSKHTARLGTPMYGLKTSSERVAMAMHLSAKGLDDAAISEVMGHSQKTIARWLVRSGRHSERLHKATLKDLILNHIQLDELVGKVRRLLRVHARTRGRRVWVWAAQDANTKAWLAWHVGGRKQADAHRLVHQVARCLAPGCVPAFTSDGLRQYFYALTAHFGTWTVVEGKRKPVWQVLPTLLYGQVRKVRAGYRLKRMYTKMLCGQRSAMETKLQDAGLSGWIQTAFIERLNLTIRHMVSALARRTWALAYDVRSLRSRVALAAAYYNFCRTHHSLRIPMGEGRYRGRTPAMALGITRHKWQMREFITHPVY